MSIGPSRRRRPPIATGTALRGVSRFSYVQARVQARYGARPAEATWQQLHALGELGALLDQARAGGLRPWVVNISATTPPHEIEQLLRAHLRERIEEAARWVPQEWREAVRWTAVLPLVPALAHLLGGQEPHDWMRGEPLLRELVAATEPELRARVLAQGALAPLAAGRAPTEEILRDRWLAEWRRRLPWHDPGLDWLVRAVDVHLAAFTHPDVGSWPARRALEAQLERFFRRAFLTPAAVFAWLLLAALELERLRAEIMRRALFSSERLTS